ncbi:MAG: hypothetical protein ACO3A2_03585 [Bdellovibrionia bacterium]
MKTRSSELRLRLKAGVIGLCMASFLGAGSLSFAGHSSERTLSVGGTEVVQPGEGAHEVEVSVKALLAPSQGYEEKNNIQAVLYGVLPNSCYSLGRAHVEQNDSNPTLIIRQYAIKQTTGMCADEAQLSGHFRLSVPFTNEVFIGNLPAGDYQLVYNPGQVAEGARLLNVATNQVPLGDTLPYALVSQISAPDILNGKDELEVTLSGILNSSCTRLDPEVKILNQGDVLVLMPTISVVPGVMCIQVLKPFEKTIQLGKLKSGIHLIHTRSMNGKAINKVVQVSR